MERFCCLKSSQFWLLLKGPEPTRFLGSGNTPGELWCVQGAVSVWAQPLIPSQTRLICPSHTAECPWLPGLLLLPGTDVPVLTSSGIAAVEQRWSWLEESVVLGSQGNAALWALLQCGLSSVTLEAFWLNRNVSVRVSEISNVQFVLVPWYSGSPLLWSVSSESRVWNTCRARCQGGNDPSLGLRRADEQETQTDMRK